MPSIIRDQTKPTQTMAQPQNQSKITVTSSEDVTEEVRKPGEHNQFKGKSKRVQKKTKNKTKNAWSVYTSLLYAKKDNFKTLDGHEPAYSNAKKDILSNDWLESTNLFL
jgi:hypothetical protein